MSSHIDDNRHLASAPIVVGVDGSGAADSALTWAAGPAVRRGRELRIVHGLNVAGMREVFRRYAVWVPPVLGAARDQGTVLVERAERRARDAAPGIRVTTELSADGPALTLLQHSASAYPVVLGASILAERLAGWREKYPDVRVERRVYPTDPDSVLQEWSKSAQPMVVGSHGHGLRSLLPGSTSNALLQHAHCPVMVVHPGK